MKVTFRFDHGKDASGEHKRALFATVRTEIAGMEEIHSVMEVPDDSVLGKEVSLIVTNMLAAKQDEIRKKNKKKLAASKKI